MKLLVQPGDGIAALVKGINSARNFIEIAIFRFDRREIELALVNAVSRGVTVHGLIAHTNRAGEDGLRKLELRLLGDGVSVARTADDLARYHGKFMIIDRRELYLMAFNLTYDDIEHSRSFGVITRSRDLVRDAVKLFEADSKRIPFEPASDRFLVSPINARKRLAAFIKGARKELAIYDPKVSDKAMARLLTDRAAAGVKVRIIGNLARKLAGVTARRLSGSRLHTRTIIRDRRLAFVGSQSLRELELDARREVGIIFRDARTVKQLQGVFDEDWALSERAEQASADESVPTNKIAKRVAKALTKDLPPVAPLLDGAVKDLVGNAADVPLDVREVEETIKDAVKDAVREAVRDVVEEVVDQAQGGDH